MQRRSFFRLIGMSGMALAAGRVFAAVPSSHSDKLELVRSAYPVSYASRNVGRACYRSLMQSQPFADLFELARIADAATPQELVAAFEAQRRADFEHGRTQLVNGWVLSRAEASLAAIFSQV